ncbi:MAG: aminopeptidase [Chromatiales bacterium]|nr:aminopeptidase [Chromatiales bacterium]
MRPLSGKGRLAAALLLLLLGGCGGGYYLQAVGGHLEVMRASQPAARLLADPGTPAPLRARLELAADALDFAHSELGLPDNGSYRSYADLGRPHVVWNVVAAPEFSLEPVQWCFPVAGCLPYRGYFREERAREFAAGLAADGHDVHVGGVSAYSTLGRFADPLLNTMLSWPPADFVALLFHELAHQHIYVRNDAAFNEGFATFVEREGLRRYLLREGREAEFCAREQALARREIVLELLIALRTELQFLYGQSLPEEETRWRKAALIETTRAEYARIAAGWDSGPRYAHLLPPGLNNAMLLAIATYEDQVPTFAALLQEQDGDLQAFYARVRELAELLPAQRAVAMNELARRARPESLARLYPCENGEAS